jgi:SAM-dependent methyltransferase
MEEPGMTQDHNDRDDAHSHHDQGHSHDHTHGHSHSPHDWHSQTYVDQWIKRDEGRDSERRPRIKQMIAMAKLPRDEPLTALDIGAGYGFVTEEVLHSFPKARVTLQDFSELMLARAREHLAWSAGQLSFVLADLTDPNWNEKVGGPFDLIVSAIAIHNLRSRDKIAACYRGVAGLLKPGAQFLDYDLFRSCGGIETHIAMMQEAGMTRVSCAWDDGHATIVAGYGKRVFR